MSSPGDAMSMPTSLPAARSEVDSADRTSRPRLPTGPRPDLRKADTWRADIGRTIQRSRQLLGWSLKELAAAVACDPRQCARWESGEERPQLDRIFAVPELRRVWILAVAEMGEVLGEVELVTTIRIVRPVRRRTEEGA
jgi:Helix-turn-helix